MLALNRMLLRESEPTRPLQEFLEKWMLLAGGQRVQPFRMLALTLALYFLPCIYMIQLLMSFDFFQPM